MIVVTAPRSRIGRQLLPILAGSAEPLRIVAREPSRLPASIRARAEIIQGSHADHEVVDRAFSGADTVFWLVPPDPRAVTRGSGLRRLHAAGMPRAGQAEVPVLGPEDLSGHDMARIMSRVLERPVHDRQIPLADYKAGLIARGLSEAMAQGMADMMAAKDAGLDNGELRTEASAPRARRQRRGRDRPSHSRPPLSIRCAAPPRGVRRRR